MIEKTIISVIDQKYTDHEYIIIDGGSTDGTVDIIKKYAEKITFWISETDKGISDAFNKGIKLAKGEYINLLNAGDIYIDDHVLELVVSQLTEPIVSFRFIQPANKTFSALIDVNAPLVQKAFIGHQSTFVAKQVYTEMGLYSTSYHIRMDYDFFLRVLPFYNLKFVDDFIISYHAGLSGKLSNRFRLENEGIIAEYLNLKKRNIYLLRIFYRPFLLIILDTIKRIIIYFFPFIKDKYKNTIAEITKKRSIQ